jgi:hypothetical protein
MEELVKTQERKITNVYVWMDMTEKTANSDFVHCNKLKIAGQQNVCINIGQIPKVQ